MMPLLADMLPAAMLGAQRNRASSLLLGRVATGQNRAHVIRVVEHRGLQKMTRMAAVRALVKLDEAFARRLLRRSGRFLKMSEVPDPIGGAEEDRTPDLCSAIAALSQLSYGP
jgi:hypothetical protein